MDFKQDLKFRIHKINERLESYLKPVYPDVLYEAMCYSALAGGKRLRPLILWGAYEAEAGDSDPAGLREPALSFACALEMIHTYSLIHDDLPAMDNDDFRRGKPTNHKVYGDAMAVLAGDGLLNKAYEIMAGCCRDYFDLKTVQAMAIIADAAGAAGMVGGQAADILQEGKDSQAGDMAEALHYIHTHKTAALLCASVAVGAVLGGADEKRRERYTLAGQKLGIAFQIKDDILNVTGNKAVLGKPVNSDEKLKKLTYVSLYGLEKAEKDYEAVSQEALAVLEEVIPGGGFLTELAKAMRSRAT